MNQEKETLYAEILEVTEHSVEVLVCLSEEPYVTQCRHFNRLLFEEAVEAEARFVMIKTHVEPGEQKIEVFAHETNDKLEELFKQRDFFKEFEDLPFAKEIK